MSEFVFLIVPFMAAACHSASPSSVPSEEASVESSAAAQASPPAPSSPAGHPQVQLTWRLFETTHSLDARGQDRPSAVFELLVNGGTPARVALGRRASFGCAAHDATRGEDEPSVVASLDCYAFAHGEYVRVLRPRAGELRVEAFGQDQALPGHEPPRTDARVVTVSIPADAEISVEPGVLTVPDEAPGPNR